MLNRRLHHLIQIYLHQKLHDNFFSLVAEVVDCICTKEPLNPYRKKKTLFGVTQSEIIHFYTCQVQANMLAEDIFPLHRVLMQILPKMLRIQIPDPYTPL